MKNILSSWTILGVLLLTIGFTQSGCKKKGDTIAKIIVLDANTQASIAGARVIIYGQSTENKQGKVVVGDTTTTNGAGEAIFNLNDLWKPGQAGVAVLNIEATKGTMAGSGIIKVEEQETSSETVFIQ